MPARMSDLESDPGLALARYLEQIVERFGIFLHVLRDAAGDVAACEWQRALRGQIGQRREVVIGQRDEAVPDHQRLIVITRILGV